MSTAQRGLSLYDAARAMGVIFTSEAKPTDRYVTVNRLKLHYLDWGNDGKLPMLLLHGRTNSAHTWDFTALAFHDSFHVIALDQRGHGESDWSPNGDYSLNAHVPDIHAFVQALGLRSIHLVGHSMGGRNSLVYASQHPERVKALVLVDVGPQTERSEAGNFRGWRHLPEETESFEEFVRTAHELNPRRTLEQLRGSLAHQLRRFPNGKWSWKWDPALREADTSGWSNERLWECVSRLRCPTMMVRGGESGLISDATVQRMTQMIPGMKAVVVPGAGHQVAGDRPALFHQSLREFFSAIP
ncbi:MAG: alpha/beta hydrolase [Chloroflexi bacterium]|nr:alpha/beta hydrolase [Chloroflexota bacterium]